MSDLIDRQAAIDALIDGALVNYQHAGHNNGLVKAIDVIRGLPSAQITIYGYNIEHLTLIATIFKKENLPPERVAEALQDISRIVLIIKDEFEEQLKNAVKEGINGVSE